MMNEGAVVAQKTAVKRLAAWASLLLMFMVWPMPHAWAASTEAAGLDVVLGIDQSGSMSGQDGAKVSNDKDGNRVHFIKRMLLPKLVEEASKGNTSRLSVVEFGDRYGEPATQGKNDDKRPIITLSQHVVLPFAGARDKAKVEQELRDAVAHIEAVSRGNTDHPEALKLMAQELEAFAQNPLPVPAGGTSGPRTRIALLITDGKPYVHDNKKTETDLLKDAQEVVVKRFKDTRFAVLGLNDRESGDLKSSYWYKACPFGGEIGCGHFWEKLTYKDPKTQDPKKDMLGTAYPALDSSDLLNKLEVVWSHLTDGINTSGAAAPPPTAPLSIGEKQKEVPPYLRELRVNVDFDQPNASPAIVKILDGQGKQVPIVRADRPTPKSLSFSVPHPQPGTWKLRPHDEPYQVTLHPVLEQADMLSPSTALPQGSDAPLRYRLQGRGPDGLYAAQPDFPPINFSVEVKAPNGAVSVFKLEEPDAAHPGEIFSSVPYHFDQPGDYRLTLRGEVANAGGSQGNVVYTSKDPQGDLVRVEQGTPVKLRVEAPAAGEMFRLMWGAGALPVKVAFIDGRDNKTVVPPGQVLAGGGLGLQWRAENAPELAKDPVFAPMTVEGDRLKAELKADLGKAFTRYLWGWDEGKYALYFQAAGKLAPGMFYLGVEGGGEWRSGTYSFQEYPLTTWLGIAALVLLLAALAAAVRFWLIPGWIARCDRQAKLRPKLRLKFTDYPDHSHTWELNSQRVIRPVPARVGLPDGTEWLIADFKIVRLLRTAGTVAVKVKYRPRAVDGARAKHASEWVKFTLENTDDSDKKDGARHPIEDLKPSIKASFVVLAGKPKKDTF